MRLQLRIRLPYKLKSNNYSELTVVDVADMWRERNVWYQGRSCQQVETEYETCSNNEWQEVSRGHSTIVVANIMGRTELCVSHSSNLEGRLLMAGMERMQIEF